ncbi:hypothetical protein ES703_123777 [subsurface metagenome]
MAVTISTDVHISATHIHYQRKLVRLSDGTLYAVYKKALAGQRQIYVQKSTNNGGTWTDETRISTATGMEDYSQGDPSIAVDSNDYLHVVWVGKATDYTTAEQLWYAKYTDSWSTPIVISTAGGMSTREQSKGCIAVDSSNYLHVVWTGFSTAHPTNMQVYYTKYVVSWSAPIVISTAAGMEDYSQSGGCIAVDSNNYLHVVWAGLSTAHTMFYQVYYTKYVVSWSAPIVLSNATGMENYSQGNACIAVDSSDYLHVVWHAKATAYPTNFQIAYTKYTASWSTPIRISTADGMDGYIQSDPSIAVDSSDSLHVFWGGKATGYTDQNKVWYATYVVSWVTPVCVQPTGRNQYVNCRWSRYPASNIPATPSPGYTNRVNYVFVEGTAAPYDLMFDYIAPPPPTIKPSSSIAAKMVAAGLL